jgi:DNA-binding transcriptional ArsR family regulator
MSAGRKVVLITNRGIVRVSFLKAWRIAAPGSRILGGTTEVSVQDIVELVGTSQSNISQHLSILREKGILVSRKDANKVYYRIADPKILQLIGAMRSAFCSTRSE